MPAKRERAPVSESPPAEALTEIGVSAMPDVPSTPPAPPEVAVAESAAATLADLASLVDDGLPGDVPRNARVLDRLAEELSEAAAMICALPGRPAEMSGHDRMLLTALRTAHTAGEDVAETIARALATLAAELGSARAVLANRPGSWEASHIRGLLVATVGDDDSGLPFYDGGAGGSL